MLLVETAEKGRSPEIRNTGEHKDSHGFETLGRFRCRLSFDDTAPVISVKPGPKRTNQQEVNLNPIINPKP